MKSRVLYRKALPKISEFPAETVLLYDSIFDKNKQIKKWLDQFPHKVSLKSGEQLKTLGQLEGVLNKITKMSVPKSTSLTFVALGGGSIGDFVGFLASVYMRGRNLVLIPSTWLAAVDSAHGGKTALNYKKAKNQIGSFFPAHKIYICEDVLKSQPTVRLQESYGEILKIAILSDAKLFQKLTNNQSPDNKKIVYKLLPKVISLKYKIVNSDPQETNGNRRLLNLGHTMGHVFESHYGIAHGTAVMYGQLFAANWSYEKNILSEKDFNKIKNEINKSVTSHDFAVRLKKIKLKKISELLRQDKKLTAHSQLDFVFIKKIGQCVRKKVSIGEIIQECRRQSAEV